MEIKYTILEMARIGLESHLCYISKNFRQGNYDLGALVLLFVKWEQGNIPYETAVIIKCHSISTSFLKNHKCSKIKDKETHQIDAAMYQTSYIMVNILCILCYIEYIICSNHIMLGYAMFFCVTLCYAMLCYVRCYVMLCMLLFLACPAESYFTAIALA